MEIHIPDDNANNCSDDTDSDEDGDHNHKDHTQR